MNVVKEIQRINDRELQLGSQGSWHDQYKDSAYIFIGGLPYELTEGDVIAIFSQYGEPVNVNMPRDKVTGKQRGFAFLMYEDQRSTVLAVDNLNGAIVLGRTLRVDHVSKYKNLEQGEDGKMKEAEEEHFNAMPRAIEAQGDDDDDTVSEAPSIDPEDPMRDWLLQRRKEEKAVGKGKDKKDTKKRKREDETPEEKAARKERKRLKKLGLKQIEDAKPKRTSREGLTPPPRREREHDDDERRRQDRHYDEERGWRADRARDDRDRREERSPRRSPLPRARDYRDDRR
ncbi:hypothetical protein CALVIDRAFT_565260 [Calocera viscosa TUFC12733]|uniref:RRM domain-containing protein n=1 Tax=Calocera viscosa (strain TUFC12733) TaxID=1330018 RepID=A0A167KPA3_CALVF|nr:hypothetical protein CALVIDRAFT_565260 [Calocera viscosa TUFC12733]